MISTHKAKLIPTILLPLTILVLIGCHDSGTSANQRQSTDPPQIEPIFFIGDSISLGFVETIANGFAADYVSDGYAIHVKEEMPLSRLYSDGTINPNGRTTNHHIDLIESGEIAVQTRGMNTVFINAGIWDINSDVPLQLYVSNLVEIFDYYESLEMNVVWCETTFSDGQPHFGLDSDYGDRIALYNEHVRNLVISREIVYFTIDQEPLALIDGVHFTNESYREIALQIVDFLQPLVP